MSTWGTYGFRLDEMVTCGGRVTMAPTSSNSSTRATPLGRVVDRASYKPNVTLKVQEFAGFTGADFEARLLIECLVPDSDEPSVIRLFTHVFPAPPLRTEEDAASWVMAQILLVERHEAREFFRVDGDRYDPPGHGWKDPYR